MSKGGGTGALRCVQVRVLKLNSQCLSGLCLCIWLEEIDTGRKNMTIPGQPSEIQMICCAGEGIGVIPEKIHG